MPPLSPAERGRAVAPACRSKPWSAGPARRLSCRRPSSAIVALLPCHAATILEPRRARGRPQRRRGDASRCTVAGRCSRRPSRRAAGAIKANHAARCPERHPAPRRRGEGKSAGRGALAQGARRIRDGVAGASASTCRRRRWWSRASAGRRGRRPDDRGGASAAVVVDGERVAGILTEQDVTRRIAGRAVADSRSPS